MSDENKPKSEIGLMVENLLKQQASALGRVADSDEAVELTDDAALEAEAAREAAAEQAARAEAEAAEAAAAAQAEPAPAESTGFKPPAWEADMQKMLQMAMAGDDAGLEASINQLMQASGNVATTDEATTEGAEMTETPEGGETPSEANDDTAPAGVGGKRA